MNVASGVPQLADYYLVGLMALVFSGLACRLIRRAVPVVGIFAGFVVYTALVNLAWAAALEDMSLLKSTLFYAYDGLLFLTALTLYSAFRDEFLKVTVLAVGASVVLQALLSPLASQQSSSRQELFFNDANQLGYFAVLAATIFALGARRFALPARYQLVVYGAAGYLAVLSQCRAALMGLAALAVVASLERPVRLLLVLACLAALYFVMTVVPPLVGKSEERFVVQGEYDTLSTRGYDRIVNHPEHILLGAGEGAYERFRSDLYGSEIHSSFGTLLFCYGLVGTAFFTCGLFLIGKANPKCLLFVIPAFVHGTAHHGVRFAFFWVMLAFVCCLALDPPADPAPGGGGETEGREPTCKPS
jgi:hypothetical protein